MDVQKDPVRDLHLQQLYSKSFPECITMADMGCSSGPNTFLPIWEVIEAIDESCRKLNRKPPILQVFLNDLPGNDFNSIFRSLPSFHKKLEEEMGGEFGPCFIAAMPGNFYGRLFPPRSLHFVHSSYSLHWFSEVPEIPLNKGSICLAKTSPPGVHKAYLNQFEKDFAAFLRSRSEEMVPGGCMVLTIYGRDEDNNSSGKHSSSIWEVFGMVLNDMVLEGLIEESKLDSFNMPFYGALAEEVKYVIQAESSFTISRLESFDVSWEASIDDRCRDTMDKYTKGKYVAKRLRAVAESILARHFGDEIVDVMFQRFSIKIGEYMETFKGAYTNHSRDCQTTDMEVQKDPVRDLQLHQVLHMNDGDGDNSYSNNSLFQKKVMLKAKPILQETIVQLYSQSFPECITMADMGCSSGPNTFLPIWEVVEAIDESCRKLNRKPPILQVFLNDLPGNDFNSIFRSLPSFHKKLEEEMGGEFGPCFVAAMPGNFYGRLFPPRSLHFVHSSYSLHWFSEVPEIPLNKGNIYLTKTSPPGVHKAYLNQFEKDFTAFLRSRSEEMVPGGCMMLTICGRDENNDSSGNHSSSIWDVFGIMLNDMGLIEESKLDSFNMPFYVALAEEVKYVIQAEKSFTIIRFESFHLSWDASIDDRCRDTMDKYTEGKTVAKGVRAITEAILARHFGDEIVDIREYMETFKGVYTSHKEPVRDLHLHQVLRTNEGDGDNSYSNNSLLQKKVILKAKPILQETVVQLYSKSFPECITMADMGCSSGPNTFLPIWEVLEAIDESCRKLNRKPPILQVFLNDLPGNDFNSIFRSLPSFHKKLEEEMGGEFGPCFLAAMPGNFYGRLFPPRSLHFVHSSYIAKTSPPGVHKAYLNQYEKDFTAFLRSRSEEMIPGGCMVLTICGRDENNDSSAKHSPTIWDIFGMEINDMVLEGLIEESKLDSFNLPIYVALAEEVKDVIRAERSFTITRLESFHVSWDACIDDRCRETMDKYTKGKYVAKKLRAVTEAILATHFGAEIVDVMFQRFSIKIGEYMETFKGVYTKFP
ncbi:hypothetical protein SADUNF_Sadunf14G0128600 [Salix dunnii]|uniref:Uncharacterized protein n=1 Tax=Salix dunnii TaxID=1413687 RepID=A0A835JG64_9ROSI|nr:hypothetical protein SADUNF_Sadunf14G0128600 [Salix dunnii]